MLDAYMHRLHVDEAWRTLTAQREKFDYFLADTHFRESWQLAVDVLGADAGWLMQRIALLTVRPEGILGRKARDCVQALAELDFEPVYAYRFRYDRLMIRELWRYQWNVASLDRLAVGERIHYRSDALCLVLLDTGLPLRIPASSRLSRHKGSASPADRGPEHLRSRLGAPNRILVVVHCPDEPMDVVRELGVIFDPEALRGVYTRLAERVAAGLRADPEPVISELYAEFPARDLSVDAALRTVLAALADTARGGGGPGAAAARAGEAVRSAQHGRPLDWQRWCGELRDAGLDPDSWAPTLVASQLVEHDVPGARCLLGRTGRALWQAGQGRMLDRPAVRAAG
ncbi:hypothetical protein ACFQY4_34015 [Catellatospora bangladeshensis]|uniref:Nucleoside diphosphate kinase-like domain-containing protein n=1 Tax=Catellatospora bangladeshensis TaxID=310355 RepID=A0A8J3JSB9_9ACTN|nr:hypothetical protein [Catellatospora bangladeshensis]GIF82299.1 hypothetical protein Cba03nite_36480 [Catellatospora bangladeshensis]